MNKCIFLSFEKVLSSGGYRIGNNIPQRFKYIDTIDKFFDFGDSVPEELKNRAVFVKNRSIFTIIGTLLKYQCIISERNFYSILGFLFKIFFRKKWIVDLQDCPFKETTCKYKKRPVKWLFSFIKSKTIYFLFRWSDSIIVSFSPTMFNMHYSGLKEKVTYFYNSLPLQPAPVEYNKGKIDNLITLIYVGVDRQPYGIKDFITHLNDYCRKHQNDQFKLTLIGHKNSVHIDLSKNMEIINDASLPRDAVIQKEIASDIGVVPFKFGSDIYYTYPIKSLESFFYCKKSLFGNCHGMKEMFSSVKSNDIHFFNTDDYSDFEKVMDEVIRQLKNGVFSRKLEIVRMFDCAEKNLNVKKIYNSVLNSYKML